MFKKLLLGLGIAGLLGLGSFGLVSADNNDDWNTEIGFDIGTGNIGINVMGGKDGDKEGKLIDVIKRFLNRVLGLLALIALVLVLWGGFKMLTAGGDEGKVKEGFKVLKQAGIGLIVIGLSWFIVSMIFWVIKNSAKLPESGGESVGTSIQYNLKNT